MRIVCGEQMGTAHLLNIASSLVPPPLCSCCGWRSLLFVSSSRISAPFLVSLGGAVGRVVFAACCGRLVPVVGSFFSYSSHQHLLGRGHSPVVSSCLLRLVRSVYHSACGRGRSSPFLVRRHVGALLASSPSGFLSSPSCSSCRPSVCFASLRYSPRPATRLAGSW